MCPKKMEQRLENKDDPDAYEKLEAIQTSELWGSHVFSVEMRQTKGETSIRDGEENKR